MKDILKACLMALMVGFIIFVCVWGLIYFFGGW